MKKSEIDFAIAVIDKEIDKLRVIAGLDLNRDEMESLERKIEEQQAELTEMKNLFGGNDKLIKKLESVKEHLIVERDGETN